MQPVVTKQAKNSVSIEQNEKVQNHSHTAVPIRKGRVFPYKRQQ